MRRIARKRRSGYWHTALYTNNYRLLHSWNMYSSCVLLHMYDPIGGPHDITMSNHYHAKPQHTLQHLWPENISHTNFTMAGTARTVTSGTQRQTFKVTKITIAVPPLHRAAAAPASSKLACVPLTLLLLTEPKQNRRKGKKEEREVIIQT